MKDCYAIEGLDCPNCAMKVERAIQKLPSTASASVDFAAMRLYLTPAEGYTAEQALDAAEAVAAKLEPEMEIFRDDEARHHAHEHEHHHHDHDDCCEHEHHHHDHGDCCEHEHHHHHDDGCHDECGCHDHHDHHHGGTEGKKPVLIRVGIAVVLLIGGVLLEHLLPAVPGWVATVLLAIAYLVSGYDILWKSVQNIRRGIIFDENFLMVVASIGAFAIGEHAEGVLVMVLYQIGEFCQDLAVEKSRRSISDLMDIRPDSAQLLLDDGSVQTVAPEQVQVGQRIRVRPGDKVPLDGTVEQGASRLDAKALTGESMPIEVEPGDRVLSGSINGDGQLILRVESTYSDSTVSRILEMVEHASGRKARSQEFITRFAKYYTPIVVGVAVLLGLIPSLISPADWQSWVYRALVFLVVSCPCALVISVPLSFFGGIGGASRKGILIKGSNYLEALAKTDAVVLDKTGTLTKGTFSVCEVIPAEGVSREELLRLASAAETCSNHPMAQSVASAYEGEPTPAKEVTEHPGRGIEVALTTGETVLCGNAKLLAGQGASLPASLPDGTAVLVAVNGRYAGAIVLEDEIKPDSAAAIAALKAQGVRRVVMLTGDKQSVGARVAEQIGIGEAYCQLLPQEKLSHLETIMEKTEGTTVFVGDGINDAPVLARADVGFAMGGIGSGAAMEAADIVIMNDAPGQIPRAINHSRRTMKIVKENIVFSLAVKLLVLILSAFGFVEMWLAVFADVGVCLLAILNAVRTLRMKE